MSLTSNSDLGVGFRVGSIAWENQSDNPRHGQFMTFRIQDHYVSDMRRYKNKMFHHYLHPHSTIYLQGTRSTPTFFMFLEMHC